MSLFLSSFFSFVEVCFQVNLIFSLYVSPFQNGYLLKELYSELEGSPVIFSDYNFNVAISKPEVNPKDQMVWSKTNPKTGKNSDELKRRKKDI